MPVSRRLRYEILRRDDHTCRYCGAKAPDVSLTVDHVTPVALGGRDEPGNLVTACMDCNSGKSSSSPDAEIVADVDADALRWAQARQVAIQGWRIQRQNLATGLAAFADAWDIWGVGSGDNRRPIPRDADWETSVERWLEQGLTVDDLTALIPKAMHNRPGRGGDVIEPSDRWRYFCGVVWRVLDDVEASTRRGLNGESAEAAVDGEDPYQQAYNEGYDQGFADGSANAQRAQAAEEGGHAHGFKDAIDWAIRNMRRPGSDPRLCQTCGENEEYGTTGNCLECWQGSLEPTQEECDRCHGLKAVNRPCLACIASEPPREAPG